MNRLEEIKKKREFADMMLNLMAETGDPRMICVKKCHDFTNTLDDMTIVDGNINEMSEEKINKLSNLIDQFQKMINDFKEE